MLFLSCKSPWERTVFSAKCVQNSPLMISVKHILCISIHQIFETQRTQKSTSVSRRWTRRCVLKSLVDWLNFDAGWMTTPPSPPAAGRRVLRVWCVPLFHHSPRCRLLLPARTNHLRLSTIILISSTRLCVLVNIL